MDIALIRFIKELLLPPGIFIPLLIFCFWLWHKQYRLGKYFLLLTLISFYLAASPIIAKSLIEGLEHYPALTPQQIKHSNAQAIVVLGAGRDYKTPEYGTESVSPLALVRLRYAAKLHRLTGLPVLAAGGKGIRDTIPEASLMAESLVNDFAVSNPLQESQSRNTAENARESFQKLNALGITHIFLVTHAWHLPRAVPLFEQAGFTVIPAPTGYLGFDEDNPISYKLFIPQAKALQTTYYALHERMGMLWYKLRY